MVVFQTLAEGICDGYVFGSFLGSLLPITNWMIFRILAMGIFHASIHMFHNSCSSKRSHIIIPRYFLQCF